jgi:hypothetical protein
MRGPESQVKECRQSSFRNQIGKKGAHLRRSLRADVVDVRIDGTSSDDELLARNDL